jgi:hypothetical protein
MVVPRDAEERVMEEKVAFTVRLPRKLYRASSAAAKRRKVSLNRLVQESLAAAIRAEDDKRLYEEFTLLGQDKELTDVEYAFEAEQEVVLRDED